MRPIDVLLHTLAFAPVFVVTAQVVGLRRILKSYSWTFIALGYVVFAIRAATIFADDLSPAFLWSTFVAYGFMMLGYRALARDLRKIL